MAIEECDNLRALLAQLSADYKQMDASVTQTEKELAALTASHAPADVIASVQDRLNEQLAELDSITTRGQGFADDYVQIAECRQRPLPKLPWTAGLRSRSH
jgi:hypothetical protein